MFCVCWSTVLGADRLCCWFIFGGVGPLTWVVGLWVVEGGDCGWALGVCFLGFGCGAGRSATPVPWIEYIHCDIKKLTTVIWR